MKAKFVKDTLFEFQKGQDPRHAMNLGHHSKVKKWFEYTWTNSWDPAPKWRINPNDGTIDILENFRMPWGLDELPEFIEFGTIYGDFVVTNKRGIQNLDFFPKEIKGDLEFYGNSIKPKKEDLLKISNIHGDIELESEGQKSARLSRQRMKERGPLRSRKSHDLRTYPTKPSEYGPKFSRGYKLYQVLKAIEDSGQEGLKGRQIRKMLKELTYGPGTYDPIEDRGWGSWYFSGPGGKGLQDKTEKVGSRYILSDGGRKYLEEYADIFDK